MKAVEYARRQRYAGRDSKFAMDDGMVFDVTGECKSQR
jgi:hypothetical protein